MIGIPANMFQTARFRLFAKCSVWCSPYDFSKEKIMIVPNYFEDLSVLHKNTLPNRAYYIPTSTPRELLPEERETSDRFLLLSGTWRFRYYENVYDLKDEFYREGYDIGPLSRCSGARGMAELRLRPAPVYKRLLPISDGSAVCPGDQSVRGLCTYLLL